MKELLELQPSEKVLEIGSGSYHALAEGPYAGMGSTPLTLDTKKKPASSNEAGFAWQILHERKFHYGTPAIK